MAVTDQTRSFTLHDGEDEKKTDELHAFLHPLCNTETPHDFEGHNSGLYITLSVSVGDTIELGEGGWVRVMKGNSR